MTHSQKVEQRNSVIKQIESNITKLNLITAQLNATKSEIEKGNRDKYLLTETMVAKTLSNGLKEQMELLAVI